MSLLCCSAKKSPISPAYCPPMEKVLVKQESSVIPQEASRLLNLQLDFEDGVSGRLRKLSEAFFHQQGDKIDLMNDWEIGGTQNKWVCPSDRHLQLRAQLKSGWSVRTATARSPTNSKVTSVISDAEQEQIRKVLERVEDSKKREQQRIGKMVDRLDKMRKRATGNGVTHCLLCHTEFGLLASKSYAAMCTDCRKYVCQRNCGVETLDSQRGELVFLCKICAEAREVLWKKSGAWFYKEMPEFVKPDGTQPLPLSGIPSSPPATSQWTNGGPSTSRNGSVRRHLPTPPTALTPDRTKSPRPRITPSWVKEKVMSSMSVEDDDRSSSEGEYASTGVIRRRKIEPTHKQNSFNRREANLQRFAALSAQHLTESEEESSPDSRASSRSTSPRRSLATPSSYDSAHHGQAPPITSTTPQHAEDARSIDSGVVQSDHSNQQATLTLSASSLTPLAAGQDAYTSQRSDPASRRVSAESAKDSVNGRESADRESPMVPASASRSSLVRDSPRVASSISGTSLVTPPPSIPRRERESPLDLRKLSISSAASTRKAANSNESMNLIDAIKASNNVRSDSPSAAFMSSPDDDSKLRRNALTRASWRDRNGTRMLSTRALSDRDAEPLREEGADASRPSSPPVRRSASGLEPSTTTTATTSSSLSAASSSGNVPADPGPELKHAKHRRASALACFLLPGTNRRTLGSIQFNITYLQEQKQLVVHLVRAKCLRAMDKNGFSDPYVKLHLIPGNAKATKLTSKTIEKTLNPEWNEEMTYYGVTDEDRQRKTLRVTVLDRDRIGSDFLGETRVALKKLPVNQMKKFNLYLEHAIPIQQEKKESTSEDRGKALVAITYNIQQGSLFVNVKRCSELIGMDSSGFSDPYCKVSLTPITSKAHRQRTSIKKRTLNPEWTETMSFIVPFKDLPKKTLQIGVYDHDVGSRDDYIGGIVVSASAKGDRGKQWIQVIENPGQTYEYWHKLELDS